jgi:hypothetical protein
MGRVIRRRLASALAAAALVPALTAAGSDDSVRLTVTFAREPGSRHVAHLRCTPSGSSADGFLRDVGARRACATARRLAGFLASKPDPHRACTQIFGGPERALVAGTIGTRRIRRAFSRTDGCKTADWRHAMPLLPRPG